MKSIDLMYQAMLAELGQRSLDAAWTVLRHFRWTWVPNVVTSALLMIQISRNA